MARSCGRPNRVIHAVFSILKPGSSTQGRGIDESGGVCGEPKTERADRAGPLHTAENQAMTTPRDGLVIHRLSDEHYAASHAISSQRTAIWKIGGDRLSSRSEVVNLGNGEATGDRCAAQVVKRVGRQCSAPQLAPVVIESLETDRARCAVLQLARQASTPSQEMLSTSATSCRE